MGVSAVSGSASGIGAAVRARLEADGDEVIGIDLRAAEVCADLSAPQGRETAVSAVLERCGGRLDRLVACAGVDAPTPPGVVASVNYFGAVALLDGLRPALERGAKPAAVAISSNSCRLIPYDNTPFVRALLDGDESAARREAESAEHDFLAYAGSKLALAVAIRRRALEWGRAGVRLNAIAPGPTETPMLRNVFDDPVRSKGLAGLPNPLGRYAGAAEIADVIAFLLGPRAAYVHGAVLYADGGIDAAIHPDRL